MHVVHVVLCELPQQWPKNELLKKYIFYLVQNSCPALCEIALGKEFLYKKIDSYRHIRIGMVNKYQLGFFSVDRNTDNFLNIVLCKIIKKNTVDLFGWLIMVSKNILINTISQNNFSELFVLSMTIT